MPEPRRRLEGRNGRIWRDYLLGTTQDELAAREGISQQRVSSIIREARASMPEDDLAEARKDHLDALRTLSRTAAELMDMEAPPAYSNGRPVLDEEGRMVRDYGTRLAALDRLLKINERAAKLLGLDAAVKADVSVTEGASQRAAEAAAAAVARLHGGVDEEA